MKNKTTKQKRRGRPPGSKNKSLQSTLKGIAQSVDVRSTEPNFFLLQIAVPYNLLAETLNELTLKYGHVKIYGRIIE